MNGDSNFPTAFFFFLFSENRGARISRHHGARGRYSSPRFYDEANSVNRGVYHDLDPSLSLSFSPLYALSPFPLAYAYLGGNLFR